MMSTFTDQRDGEVYRTVEINGQTWLAENLRYKGPIKKFNNWTVEEKNFYFAPDGRTSNIKEYGCLYTWANALKAVPEGWHLPSKEDFNNLLKHSGSKKAKQFKALAAPDWNGDNSLGFGALPAGYWWYGYFDNFGYGVYFWSATEYGTDDAYDLCLNNNYVNVGHDYKNSANSVRCIKD